MTEPVYVVSGYPRSGTTAAMRALEAGGLMAEYSDKRNQMARAAADDFYQPNPENDLRELADWQYREFGFPAKFAGKLIKVVTMHSRNMDVAPAKVLFMRRNAEEIRQSYMAFFPQQRPPSVEMIENEVAWTLRQMNDRKSFEVYEMWYPDMLANPVFRFECLELRGWPIDPLKAAAEVRPELQRYRAEELTAGIR